MAGGIRDLEALFHSDHFFLGNVMLIKKSVNYIDHLDKFLVITMKFCSIKKKKEKEILYFWCCSCTVQNIVLVTGRLC